MNEGALDTSHPSGKTSGVGRRRESLEVFLTTKLIGI